MPAPSRPHWRRRRRLAFLAVLLLILWTSVESPARRMAEERPHRIVLVDYGLHLGIALPRRPFAQRALFTELPPSDWLEIGWGDEKFYRETADIADFNVAIGLRAIAGLGETALHVVALPGPPETVFAPSVLTEIQLDDGGLDALASDIEKSLSRPIQPLGDGHWAEISMFYRSPLTYGPTQICNHWVSNLLNAAGLPSSTLWSTHPRGLIWELRLRGRPTEAKAR